MSVASDYPAKEQPDGRIWFKAAVRNPGETWGWTADPAQAHPDYQVKIGNDGSAVTWVGDLWAPAPKVEPAPLNEPRCVNCNRTECNGGSTCIGPDAHITGCNMWHHQGGDYDRDCPACMAMAAADNGLQRRRERVLTVDQVTAIGRPVLDKLNAAGWPGDCPDCYRTGEQRQGCNCLLPERPATAADLDDALKEGYVDHDRVQVIAAKLVAQAIPATTTTKGTDMPAKTKAAPVITEVTNTTGEDLPGISLPDDPEVDAPRFTEWMRYPLPPAPPRAKVSYDGYGRYKLPSPSTGRPTGFSRATTIAKTLEETYNLSRWSRRQAVKAIIAAVGAADADEDGTDVFDTAGSDRTPVGVLGDVMAAIVAEDDRALDAAVDLLDNLTGGADARELGEAVHAWLEAVDIGTVLPWQVPTMFQPYVAAARDALRRAGLVAVAEYVERIVLNDRGDETVVGTIDRIYRVVTTGELIMGDVKTSKTLDYSWLPYSVQVGGVYGYATKMFRADADVSQGQHGWEPMPEIGQKFAVILHVPSDQPERSAVVTIDMYFGGESMVASLDARKRRKESTKKVPFVHEIPVPSKAALRYVEARDAVLDTTDAKDLALTWESYQDVWTDDLTELGNHVVQLLDAAASATA